MTENEHPLFSTSSIQQLAEASGSSCRAYPNSAFRDLRADPGSDALVSRHRMETPRLRSSLRYCVASSPACHPHNQG